MHLSDTQAHFNQYDEKRKSSNSLNEEPSPYDAVVSQNNDLVSHYNLKLSQNNDSIAK